MSTLYQKNKLALYKQIFGVVEFSHKTTRATQNKQFFVFMRYCRKTKQMYESASSRTAEWSDIYLYRKTIL